MGEPFFNCALVKHIAPDSATLCVKFHFLKPITYAECIVIIRI